MLVLAREGMREGMRAVPVPLVLLMQVIVVLLKMEVEVEVEVERIVSMVTVQSS